MADRRLADLSPHQTGKILGAYLQRYLQFTEWVELDLVNPVAHFLSRPELCPFLPGEAHNDALLVYIDEGAHTQFSKELSQRVANEIGIDTLGVPIAAEGRLNAIFEATPPEYRWLARIASVIVSETLITATLASAAEDPQIQSVVRDVLRDHKADEGRHHAYFAEVLRLLVPALHPEAHSVLVQSIAQSLPAYLGPDVLWLRTVLEALEIEHTEALCQVAATGLQSFDALRRASATTLKACADSGLFDNPGDRQVFRRAGLL